MTSQLVLGSFNSRPYPAVEFFPEPRIGRETLTREHQRIPLTDGEAMLSLDQLVTLHGAEALAVQRKHLHSAEVAQGGHG